MVIKSRFLVTALLWSTSLSLFACSPSPLEKGGFGVKAVAGLSNAGPISQSMKQRLKVLHHQLRRPENKKDYQQTFLKDVLPKQGRRNKKGGFGIKSLNAPFIEDFSTATASFGDGTNGWFEWGGDYSRDPNSEAVKLNNPGTTSNVVESGLTKTIPLSGVEGDTLIAKMKVKSTFTADSDTTLVLYFNDSAQTVAVSDTSRGSMAGEQTLYIETTIPAGATNVTIAPLVYLAAGEQSTALIDEISVEEIPSDHYSKINLLDEPFDEKGTNDYGPNSPLNVDSEFGHDFYVVDNWPQKYSGDGAVTLWNGGPGNHSTDEGGLVKRVDLTNTQPGDKLSAYIYTAPTFNNADSMAEFKLEFYNESNSLLSTIKSTAVRGSNYKWLFIDRQPIPTGATYVKLVPTVKLGASEASSLLWDDLRLYQYSESQEQPLPSIQAEIGPAGGVLELPGVGKLEIPAGAVTTPTTIKLSHFPDSEVLNEEVECEFEGTTQQQCHLGWIRVTPVVKLEPMGFRPKLPVILHLTHFPEAYHYSWDSLREAISTNPSNGFDRNSQDVTLPPHITSIMQDLEREWPITVKRFGYITKQAKAQKKISLDNDFQIQQAQQTGNCETVRLLSSSSDPKFIIIDKNSDNSSLNCQPLNSLALENAAKYLNNAYDYYRSIGLPIPKRWDRVRKIAVNDESVPITVEMGTKLVGDGFTSGIEMGPTDRGLTNREYSGETAAKNLTTEAKIAHNKTRLYQGAWLQLNPTEVFYKSDNIYDSREEYIKIGSGTPKPGLFDKQKNGMTAAHELFHLFQYDYTDNLAEEFEDAETYFREGTASYMGFMATIYKRGPMGFSVSDLQFPSLNQTPLVREYTVNIHDLLGRVVKSHHELK